MYSTVIFDLDGTLLNTLEDLAAAGNHTLEALGFAPHPVAAYRQMVGSGVAKLIQRMLPAGRRGEDTLQKASAIFAAYYNNHMLDFTAPYPGIEDMLQNIKVAGVRAAVLSNKTDAFVQPIVARYFPNTFGFTMGLRPEFAPKPDPASVLHIMQAMGAEMGSTLYCGDSDVDMLTAHAAGLPACGVLWGFRTRQELAHADADFLVEDAPALQQLILG